MSSNPGIIIYASILLLASTTFYVQYTIFVSVHQVSSRALVDDRIIASGRSLDINTLNIAALDHQVDVDAGDAVILPSSDNFYIADKHYVTRRLPALQVEQNRPGPEPTAYKVVAELGRRYAAKYIIDIGCGSGKHLANLAHEFNVIGVDYGVNLEKARTAYPHLTFLNADLDSDKGCKLSLPEDILFQSIVMSAEVIEHLVDPLYCLVRVLRHVSAYAAAVIVTSPDRQRLSSVFHWQHRLNGPPINKHHVREWTMQELSAMFTHVGMHVVLGAWICGRANGCPSGYSTKKNPYVNQLLVLGNGNVRRIWQDQSLPVNVKVTAFVVVHPKTAFELVTATMRHLTQQDVQIYVIRRACNITALPADVNVMGSVYVPNMEQAVTVMKAVIATENFRYGDWFFVQDAHEIVSILPSMQASNLTLRQYFQRVAYEPYGFNAIPTTVLLMNSTKGPIRTKASDRIPFRILTAGAWDTTEGKTVYPRHNSLQDRVRAFRKTYSGASFFLSKTALAGLVVTDVNFVGRHVYPFHLVSRRFHPRTKFISKKLSTTISKMYGLEIGMGYTTATRKAMYQFDLPF